MTNIGGALKMIKTQGKYGQANVYTDNLENSAYGQMAQSDIDGALVGGASLKAQSFVDIILGAKK